MLQGKWLRSITMATALCGILAQSSCKKENGIDNNNVISTPYSLFYSDGNGALFNTNDGLLFKKVFNGENVPMQSIVTSGNNILFVKYNLQEKRQDFFLSYGNSNQFNINNTKGNPAATHRSQLLDVPSHDRLYACATAGYGILYSNNHGETWVEDRVVDTPTIGAAFYPTSLAQLKSGDLFAISNFTNKLYKRIGKDDKWFEVIPSGLPASGVYFLSRLNDALIATDQLGGGVYFSNDKGLNWAAYSGTSGLAIYDTYAPFDQTLMIGTNNGIYRLVSGSFVASNSGLTAGAVVYSITAKMDTYKNGAIKQYIYLATNKGLFRSEDGGQNWVYMDDPYHLDATPHDTRLVY